MSPLRIIKSLFFWSYGRTTWQYDVLCALILAFIFLTPKSWFDESKLSRPGAHQNPSTAAVRLLLWPENRVANPLEIERHVRTLTGRHDARVKEIRAVRDNQGRIIAYEVDTE